MSAIRPRPISSQFHGKPIVTLEYAGRPCWVAREIGAAMGYVQDGKRLVDRISSDWAADFIENRDYQILKGNKLKDFISLAYDGTDSVPSSKTARAMILYESGLHISCLKTTKPIGRRLRRFLAEQVLPQLARNGDYKPHKPPKSNSDGRTPDPRADTLRQREQRLRVREERLKKKQKSASIQKMLTYLTDKGQIDAMQQSRIMILATEIESGVDFPELKKQIETNEHPNLTVPSGEFWQPPSSVAKKLGQSLGSVCAAISQLGFRGNIDGICRPFLVTGPSKSRPRRTTFLYSPFAVEIIKKKPGVH